MYLNNSLNGKAAIEALPIVKNSLEAESCIAHANADRNCIGIIVWMHTFSPAKMWIKALQILNKPMLHLHTQFNERLPYSSIDMDFMNLNQSAHGDRVESEIKYGWNVNYYGIGDLCKYISQITDAEIDTKMSEYTEKYEIDTENINRVREQAKYEVALQKFISTENLSVITDTFEDLCGLEQLPGIAVQNMMAKGIGFGPEGDYKTAALSAILFEMAKYRSGATGFTEDYTYDLSPDNELELASHMLEISPVFAKNKPKIQVHPLGIGGKSDPAKLVFDGISGDGIAVSMIDMGNRFRIICADITLTNQPEPMPKLPVARLMWKLKPDFKTGTAAWIYAGGAHHAVVSTALTSDDIHLFAKLTNTELVLINEKTDLNALENQLSVLEIIASGR